MDEFEIGAAAQDDGVSVDTVETSVETGPLIWEGEWDKSDMI